MGVAVIKYNAGNNFSVLCALRRLGVEGIVTDSFDVIRNADKVIFPGVGEASSAMTYLRERGLDSLIRSLKQPVLGICIGQQLMCRHSQEGDTDCLGIFDADVVRFPAMEGMKIPHMDGTRSVSGHATVSCPPLPTIPLSTMYIVSMCRCVMPPRPITDYIVPFSASMRKDNFYSTQFHPEKSGDVGELIIKNFLES